MIWNRRGRMPRPAAVLVGAVLTVVLAGRPASAQKAEPCLAGSWELSGPLAHSGLAVRMGIETAVEEINEAGGVLGQKLRVIAYDDQGEPSRAVDNARR